MTELVTTQVETSYEKAIAAVANLNRLKTKADKATVARVNPSTEPLVLKENAQQAVENFAEAAKTVEFPTRARELTPKEINAYIPLFQQVQGLDSAAKAARQRIKDAVYAHLDIELEDDGGFKGKEELPPRNEHGYVAEGALTTDESPFYFSREVKNYAPELPVEALLKLYREGKINKADYYKATRRVEVPREIDEDGFADLLEKKPELASVFAEVLVTKPPTTALNLRKKDKAPEE